MASINININTKAIHAKLDRLLAKETQIMATLDQILAEVSAQTTKIDSLDALMDGIRQQLADVLSGVTLPAGMQEKVDAIFAAAMANTTKIDAAIAENTGEPGEPVA